MMMKNIASWSNLALGLTLPHFEFWACICLIKIEAFYTKKENFDLTYLRTGSKTQNVEELNLDIWNFKILLVNINSFSKQNSKLRIHSKRDRNQLRLTVCSAEAQTQTQTTLFTFMKRAKIQTAMCVLAFYILLNLPEFLSDPSVFLAVLINTDASEKRVIPLSK